MAGLNNNVFHIEFGFNETELTTLLDTGSYQKAENLILQNAHASYLDEGCYERTPLNVVLSGKDINNEEGAVRNLYIAKCLVQHGASPNYRVPKTDFGYYLSPGETPVELLVHFYNTVTAHDTCVEILEEADVYRTKHNQWHAKDSPVIGMNNKYITSLENLKEDLLSLVFIMLSHGGDSNILNEVRQTLLHRTAAYSNDVRLLECLCENGADINAVDAYGNTALMYVCRYCQLVPYHMGEINDYDENPLVWVKRTMENCCSETKYEFVKALLHCADIQVDIKNKHGKTALFYCMERGDWQNALLLLQKYCSVTDKGKLSDLEDFFYTNTSPLFISMYSSQAMNYFRGNYMRDIALLGSNQVFPVPLIDPGYFDHKQILAELYQDIQENMRNVNLLHMKQFGSQILHLLFGHGTCTLRQLCTRQVFQRWMQKYSQEVFSLPDSDDEFLKQLPKQAMDNYLKAVHENPFTVGVSVNTFVDDDVILLSSFQSSNHNSNVGISENNTASAEVNEEESNDLQGATGESQEKCNATEVTENMENPQINDGEENQILQKELDNTDLDTKDMESNLTEKTKSSELNSRNLKGNQKEISSSSSSTAESSDDPSEDEDTSTQSKEKLKYPKLAENVKEVQQSDKRLNQNVQESKFFNKGTNETIIDKTVIKCALADENKGYDSDARSSTTFEDPSESMFFDSPEKLNVPKVDQNLKISEPEPKGPQMKDDQDVKTETETDMICMKGASPENNKADKTDGRSVVTKSQKLSSSSCSPKDSSNVSSEKEEGLGFSQEDTEITIGAQGMKRQESETETGKNEMNDRKAIMKDEKHDFTDQKQSDDNDEGSSQLKNGRKRLSSNSISTADSSDDSCSDSSISRASTIHWPTRFSDLWSHLRKVTAEQLDKELVTVLHLPKDTLICFEIELLRLSLFLSRVTTYNRMCDWQIMERANGRGSNEQSEEDSSSDVDESDDEYW